MTHKSNVLVLGYGEMGHAMEFLLEDCCQLTIWDQTKYQPFIIDNLEEAVLKADVIIFCLPVNPHRQIAERIVPLLKDNSLCLSIAKGLDGAGQTAAQIFADVLGATKHRYALLYGPMISEEICAERYAFAQLGCVDKDCFHQISQLFQGTRLTIQETPDITGISWSVILKNVYALIFGISDELQLGDNMRGFLMVTALHELEQIVRLMGGSKDIPYHLAGLGDLVTTATSEDSHHHELGRMLARGETENITGEGIHTLQMVQKYKLIDTSNYPLFRLITQIVQEPQNAVDEIDDFLVSS